jgi:hypothetical protein
VRAPVSEKVTFQSDALFAFDKAVLQPQGRTKLDELVARLQGMTLEAIVATGHTDSVGGDVYNDRLSMRRAEAVKAYLVSATTEANRVFVEGKGEKQPVADNATADGRAQNRRVQIEVVGTRTRYRLAVAGDDPGPARQRRKRRSRPAGHGVAEPSDRTARPRSAGPHSRPGETPVPGAATRPENRLVTSPPQRVAVVGAGAVGSFFGAMLARAGHAVTLVARAPHVAAIERSGLRVERSQRRSRGRAIGASTDLAAVRGADLVLFCVKSTDTDAVAEAMAPHLADQALVLSLQNGVENAATIARRVRQLVVPAVVLRRHGDARAGRGEALRPRRPGDRPDARGRAAEPALAARLQGVVDVFATAGVPVVDLARRDGRALVQADGELRLQRHLRPGPAALRRDGQAGGDPRAAAGGGRRGRGGGRGRRRRAAARARARGDGRHRRGDAGPALVHRRRTWRAASRARSIT